MRASTEAGSECSECGLRGSEGSGRSGNVCAFARCVYVLRRFGVDAEAEGVVLGGRCCGCSGCGDVLDSEFRDRPDLDVDCTLVEDGTRDDVVTDDSRCVSPVARAFSSTRPDLRRVVRSSGSMLNSCTQSYVWTQGSSSKQWTLIAS